MSSAKNVIETFRDVVQDLLVPEMKALKVSVDSLHTEMGYLRTETKGSIESLRNEVMLRNEKLEQLIKHSEEKNEGAILTLAQKLDGAIEIRERLASIEARLPRQ